MVFIFELKLNLSSYAQVTEKNQVSFQVITILFIELGKAFGGQDPINLDKKLPYIHTSSLTHLLLEKSNHAWHEFKNIQRSRSYIPHFGGFYPLTLGLPHLFMHLNES